MIFKRISNINKVVSLLLELSKREFRLKYLGSLLGVIWAFVHPIVLMLIFWFVFQVGFRPIPVDNVPFIFWLMAGMVPWFFFSEALSSSASSITENSFLVKKVVFKVELLPIVKVITALKVHVFFIFLLFIISFLYGYEFNIYKFQIIYYLSCTIVLSIGIGYISSALSVFLKDVGQIIAMSVQFGTWLTPIFWTLKMIPDKFHFLVKLNPVYYIVEGYRASMFRKEWIWDHPYLLLYFWVLALFFLFFGYKLFQKLKPHFADVL